VSGRDRKISLRIELHAEEFESIARAVLNLRGVLANSSREDQRIEPGERGQHVSDLRAKPMDENMEGQPGPGVAMLFAASTSRMSFEIPEIPKEA